MGDPDGLSRFGNGTRYAERGGVESGVQHEPPDKDLRDRLDAYAHKVESTFGRLFQTAATRFPHFESVLSRFREAVAAFQSGRSPFGAVDEAHNELCVAAAILDADATVARLTYEPSLPGSPKTIDFKAELTNGQVIFVDVKTIRPDATDRWDQYQKALQEKWFPPGVKIDLVENALGGEMWHDLFAARSRMLEYTLELEEKVAEISANANCRVVLALCSDGFRWSQDELEDFVAFYISGRHRSDDALAKMEHDHMRKQSLRLSRTIHRFAWICRSQRDIHPIEINWNVQPPEDPGQAWW
ncbi:MAG TPA: hypothetical protein VF618_23305 [Thermoanaerobaculia bacterium]